jgi:hypothetical protein
VCSCGNIRVHGPPLPPGVYPNIPANERPHLMACRSVLTVQPRAFQIRDLQQTASKMQSSVCTDFSCVICSQVFRIFSTRAQTYVAKLPESAPLPQRTNAPPPVVSELISLSCMSQRPPRNTPEDPDFDMMFSREADPIVGSYRPYPLPSRGTVSGLEGVARSYYA